MATARSTSRAGSANRPSLRNRFTLAGILLGVGLGWFVDGIVLHQILQWHHMLTDYGDVQLTEAVYAEALVVFCLSRS